MGTGSLSKKTYKFSKDIETERNECVKKLYSILHSKMKCMIEEQNSGAPGSPGQRLTFTLNDPMKIRDVIGKGYIFCALNDRNAIPLYDVAEDLIISSKHYVDYISEKGTSMLLEIVPENDTIPASFLSFSIIPIKRTVHIVSAVMIGRMEGNEEILYCKKTDLMQGTHLYNNWRKKDVEEFHVKGFNVFLGEIAKELEVRRIQMSRNPKIT